MKRSTSRRAALGAFAAAAMVPAGIGLANPGAGAASPDAALLAIAPKLLPLLEQAEAMYPEISRLYEEADEARQNTGVTINFPSAQAAFEEVSERNGYAEKWEIRSKLLDQAEALIAPFLPTPPCTLEGLLLRARFAEAMDMEWIPQEDIAALLKQRWGVATRGEA